MNNLDDKLVDIYSRIAAHEIDLNTAIIELKQAFAKAGEKH